MCVLARVVWRDGPSLRSCAFEQKRNEVEGCEKRIGRCGKGEVCEWMHGWVGGDGGRTSRKLVRIRLFRVHSHLTFLRAVEDEEEASRRRLEAGIAEPTLSSLYSQSAAATASQQQAAAGELHRGTSAGVAERAGAGWWGRGRV